MEVVDQIVELGTGPEVVKKEVFDKYFEFTKEHFTSDQADLIDAYIAVETLGAVLAKALGIPRIQATVEDDANE